MTGPWFYEQRVFDRWCPVKVATRPVVKNGILVGAESGHRRIRSLRAIPEQHQHLTLRQLQEVYGDEGKFRSVRRA
jgi:hypothetical protein